MKLNLKKTWKKLGPGLITGSSDDDPSGIVTYSQAGAGFGLATLWTAFVTYPLMYGIQEMCARIGIVTGCGLIGLIKKRYHKSLIYLILLICFPAITFNIAADLSGMGAICNLMFPDIPVFVFHLYS
jgi:Mn2+/Fe2+ NRAMP family transporter